MVLRFKGLVSLSRVAAGWILILVLAASSGCSRSTWQSGELEAVEGMGAAAGYYMPSRSPAQITPVEELVAEPEYAGTPYYGSYTLGDAQDNVISYVLDVEDGGDNHFYLDANNNEDLTDDGDGAWDRYAERNNVVTKSVMVPYLEDGNEMEVPLQFFFYFFNGEDPTVRGVLYARDFARVGEVKLAGKTYRVAIAENTNDGVFDLKEAGADTLNPNFVSMTIDLNRDGELLTDRGSPEHYALGEPFIAGGRSYTIDSISPMGDRITFRLSEVEGETRTYIEVGYEAPDFSQEDCRGNMINLKEYLKDHEVLLLDFWATWCGPCISELPHVIPVYEKYKDRGFGILSISLDLAPDAENPTEWQKTREEVRAFMDEQGMEWPSTYDGLYWRNAVSQQYRINSIPATLLLDSDGIIRYKDLRGGALEEAVKDMLEGSGR